MKDNKHTQSIPDDVLVQLKAKIAEAAALIAPYVVALTPDDRHNMLKMGEKSLAFVEKAYEYAQQNPTLVPPYLNMSEFGIDFADAHGLWTVRSAAEQLFQNVDDTEMTAGSEAYQSALVFYNSVKVAAANNVPGAKAVYDELKLRYPGGKRKTEVEG